MKLKGGILVLGLFWGAVALGMVGGGDVEFKMKGAGPVLFSHDTHVGSHFLACTECHDSLYTVKGKHRHVTMDQMAKGLSCGACHNGLRAFSVKDNCQVCHQ
jgi:c(7)-type cytochrome triheme protein